MNNPNPSAVETLPPCLLCGTTEPGVFWRLTGADVRALWRSAGYSLTEEAFGSMRAETGVSQFECRACGFRYFDPALAGHGIFYAELERNGYYVENRTEFEFALKLCQSAGAYSVLDSDGHFSSQRDLSCCARSENHEPRDY